MNYRLDERDRGDCTLGALYKYEGTGPEVALSAWQRDRDIDQTIGNPHQA